MFEYFKNLVLQYVEIEADEIKEESRLRTDLGLTSFDIVNIAEDVSAEYSITIPDEDILTIKTVGDYLNYIKEKVK